MNQFPIAPKTSQPHSKKFARIAAGFAMAAVVLATASFSVSARNSTPTESGYELANLGYSELRLTTDDNGFESPSTIAAGRYLVVLENLGSADGPAAISDVNFLQLPAGVTLDELNQLFTTGGEIPDWYDDIVSTGGFSVAAGDTGYGVLELSPGEWLVGVGDTNPFRALTVTDNGSAQTSAVVELPADLTIQLSESGIGIPDQISSGRQVWHATNSGEQLHEIVLVKTQELLTVEQVVAILTLPEGDPLPAGVPDPATFEFPAAGVKPLSAGREVWVEMDLAPGYYVAICLVPDAAGEAPHSESGLIDIFTVGDNE